MSSASDVVGLFRLSDRLHDLVGPTFLVPILRGLVLSGVFPRPRAADVLVFLDQVFLDVLGVLCLQGDLLGRPSPQLTSTCGLEFFVCDQALSFVVVANLGKVLDHFGAEQEETDEEGVQPSVKKFDDAPTYDFMRGKMEAVIESVSAAMRQTI